MVTVQKYSRPFNFGRKSVSLIFQDQAHGPVAVLGHSVPDFKTWTFYLRKNAKWLTRSSTRTRTLYYAMAASCETLKTASSHTAILTLCNVPNL